MKESSKFLSPFVFLLACIPGMTGQYCPDSSDILPCTCSGADENGISVDCSDATSSAQIFAAFNDAVWPFKNLAVGLKKSAELGGIFLEVFEDVSNWLPQCIIGTVPGLNELLQFLLDDSSNMLSRIEVGEGAGPFVVREKVQSGVPQQLLWREGLKSRAFSISDNQAIEEMPEGTFGDVSFRAISITNTAFKTIHPSNLLASKDRLEYLTVTHSSLDEFIWDALPNFPKFEGLTLGTNAFTEMPPFESLSMEEVNLYGNQIIALEAGSFAPNLLRFFLGFPTDANINLSWNSIVYLIEESFRPIVEVLSLGGGNIGLEGNPVVCDCSMAWLALNPGFLESVSGRCPDGTPFSDLFPEDFQECGTFD
ncbi:unnamed protein product [Darwinula stevensoni]|uniref:Oplophorus-luciferin 2-monooxygenase non-catalytic subunit n=1 Tax=Darwinula stevensoni TaxID=69355 RepID=A0A7R9A9P9_9CRUS|nr:unnamed protein product [Darwinula stevensoni]CAG0897664.1 unnamed protein product [Darwinula stevensoni]